MRNRQSANVLRRRLIFTMLDYGSGPGQRDVYTSISDQPPPLDIVSPPDR